MSTEKTSWFSSLTFKILASCMVLLACLFGAVFVASQALHGLTIARLEERTGTIVQGLEIALEEYGKEEPSDFDKAGLEEMLSQLHVFKDEDLILDFNSDEHPEWNFSFPSTDQSEDNLSIILFHPVSIPMPQGGELDLRVGAIIPPSTDILNLFQATFLWILVGFFLITLAAMGYSVLKMLRPLRALTEACTNIRSGNLNPVKVERGSSEITLLETKFNEMIESLGEKEVVEQRLSRAQKLSALGTLAAGVAHDIGNPLNAVKLIASHIADGDSGDNLKKREGTKHYAQTIVEEVARMEKTIQGFLDLSKERDIAIHPVELDRILEEVHSLVRRESQNRDIRCEFKLNLNGESVKCDQELIKRVVLNLVLNALDATPSQGKVYVRSSLQNGECRIEVEDTGHGMDEEVLARAFEPYFTTKPAGTGLGLALAHRIVEQHEGNIDLRSAPGQGTRVEIRLPVSGPKVEKNDVEEEDSRSR